MGAPSGALTLRAGRPSGASCYLRINVFDPFQRGSVMKARIVSGLLAAAVVVAASPHATQAQSSTTRGWSLSFQSHGTSLSIEDADPDTGAGAGIRAGYGFNRRFTLYFQADGGIIDVEESDEIVGEWRLGHADLGVRFHFANSLSRWIPFLDASGGVRAVSVEGRRDR